MAESRIPNLKKLRTERLLTQSQLAIALGVASRTLIRWEAGEGEPGLLELQTLARFFNVSVDQLLSDLLATPSPTTIIRVAALEGRQLDFWVARAEGIAAEMIDGLPVFYEAGVGHNEVLHYSSDSAALLPIIESRRIHLQPAGHGKFEGKKLEGKGWLARCDDSSHVMYAPTMLAAACGAIVASSMGVELIG